jgi:peptidoglycan/xylan/chitin deacetylase (PgdA/CDA1 family)
MVSIMNLRTGTLIFLISTCMSVTQCLKADESAVVFMYHRFDEQKFPSTSIRTDQFRMQLDYLRDGGFAVIPMTELIAFLKGGQPLPPKAVVITIDDAYLSIYEVAYPLFSEHGFPFTVFVSTDAVDNKLPAYLNWEQVREMAAHGVTFANHGAAHISMARILPGESDAEWRKRITADIEKGSRRLKEELPDSDQLLQTVFAYPYGEYNTGSAEELTKFGYIAFGQQSGAIGRHGDQRALPRFPMAESFAGMDGFRTKAASLPLPVLEVEPWDPVTSGPIPEILLTLGETDARLGELACFVTGQGKVDVRWVEPGRQFAVGPKNALQTGRHRVNCTAPRNDGRYYWFSHQWITW